MHRLIQNELDGKLIEFGDPNDQEVLPLPAFPDDSNENTDQEELIIDTNEQKITQDSSANGGFSG